MSSNEITADQLKIIVRCTHILVYQPDLYNVKENMTILRKKLTLYQDGPNHTKWPLHYLFLYGTDPNGVKILRIPVCVALDTLAEVWPYHTISMDQRGWTSRSISVLFKAAQFPYRNAAQGDMVRYLTKKEEACRILVSGTASGKSYCAIRAWSESGQVLLGTFAQITHLQNFLAEILRFTNTTQDEILIINNGRKSIAKALLDDVTKYKAVLVLHRTIRNCIDAVIDSTTLLTMDDFSKLIIKLGIGLHISDECHLELINLMRLALVTNVHTTFYLTATLGRTNWREDALLKFQLPIEKAFVVSALPRLEVKRISFNSEPEDGFENMIISKLGHFNIPGYFDYLLTERAWTKIKHFLLNVVSESLADNNKSIGIVVSGRLDFLDQVELLMRENFPNYSVGNFSSRTKASDKIKALDCNIVVTTEKSFNGSVNPTNMTTMILVSSVISSSIWIKQVTGRLRGINNRPCVVYDLHDQGFVKTKEAAKKRLAIYRKIAVSIVDCSFSEAHT